ncbi:hypothetical protein ABZW03_20755 [Kitasatospora sp. NPDC004799]|uniref:hypothetical protein n=1 Tax=Kitasatospora sp. NPDC004799 TaxID=3154460 RepID=UPI0033A6E934
MGLKIGLPVLAALLRLIRSGYSSNFQFPLSWSRRDGDDPPGAQAPHVHRTGVAAPQAEPGMSARGSLLIPE